VRTLLIAWGSRQRLGVSFVGLLVGFASAWFVWPIDLVPEFIPVLGSLDDVVVAAVVLRHVLGKSGPDVIAEHWSGDQASLGILLRVAR
jgi:uncharacterized membrane protein YkvA (DUF1232 family)